MALKTQPVSTEKYEIYRLYDNGSDLLEEAVNCKPVNAESVTVSAGHGEGRGHDS